MHKHYNTYVLTQHMLTQMHMHAHRGSPHQRCTNTHSNASKHMLTYACACYAHTCKHTIHMYVHSVFIQTGTYIYRGLYVHVLPRPWQLDVNGIHFLMSVSCVCFNRWGMERCSVVKGVVCSCRGPEFESQHPHQAFQAEGMA